MKTYQVHFHKLKLWHSINIRLLKINYLDLYMCRIFNY